VKPKSLIIFVLFSFITSLKVFSNPDSLKVLLNSTKGERKADVFNQLCIDYLYVNTDSAMKYAQLGLQMTKKEGFNLHSAHIVNVIGNIYSEKGELDKAIEYYIQADKMFEEIEDVKGRILTTMNIGRIYAQQDLFDKALIQYNSAIDISKANGLRDYYAQILSQIGTLYYSKGDKFKALDYYKQSLEISQFIKNSERIMECLNNVAVVYQELGKYAEALKNFNIYLDYSRKAGEQRSIVAAYHNIALVYKDKKEYPSAVKYMDSSIYLAKNIKDFDNLREAYSTLSEIYKEQNNLDKALEYFQLSAAAKDSLLAQTRDNQLIEMSTKYETEKKETENQLLNQQIKIKDVESSRQQIAIVLIGIILFIVGVVAFILIRQNRLKNKINKELEEKNHIIHEQHKDITDSIQYSKRIQEAILPPMQLWHETMPESFVLYKPKDILSGDFYWMEKSGDTLFFAAADCTGHGVPGAMVSVICSTALNRAVKEFGIKDTGAILDKVRDLVLETFAKSESNVQDGMDISICALNTTNHQLKWSGANNPLWYLSHGEPREITADKQPIGKTDSPLPFTTHTLQMNSKDIIYIFTDGYADQFGGPKGKKFKYKQLKELLVANASKPMEEQKEILLKAFNNWKGNLEQIDDVCIIGVRL
jgi:serine phosphatase RsbU (regulator of sigma subunit)